MKYIAAIAAAIALLAIFFYFAIRMGIEGTITSWFRSPWHNQEVGGVANSWHLFGLAFDVAPVSQHDFIFLSNLASAWPLGKVLNEGTHLHFQVF